MKNKTKYTKMLLIIEDQLMDSTVTYLIPDLLNQQNLIKAYNEFWGKESISGPLSTNAFPLDTIQELYNRGWG